MYIVGDYIDCDCDDCGDEGGEEVDDDYFVGVVDDLV